MYWIHQLPANYGLNYFCKNFRCTNTYEASYAVFMKTIAFLISSNAAGMVRMELLWRVILNLDNFPVIISGDGIQASYNLSIIDIFP